MAIPRNGFTFLIMVQFAGDDTFIGSDYPHAEGFVDPVRKTRERAGPGCAGVGGEDSRHKCPGKFFHDIKMKVSESPLCNAPFVPGRYRTIRDDAVLRNRQRRKSLAGSKIPSPPPTSLQVFGIPLITLREKRAFGGNPAPQVHRRTALVWGSNREF